MLADARVLWHLLRGQPRAEGHAERLEAFYAPQAERYDHFRERLLHGRRELVERLPVPPGGTAVDLGGGTGRNLEFFGSRLADFARVEVVDLCPSLLARARMRAAGWPNVAVVEADATRYRPAAAADAVLFSYSLTMIPDWRAALDNAQAMLKPGGILGVVDFYVSEAAPAPGRVRHGALTRRFWPAWFGHDGVRLDPAHLPALARRFEPLHIGEHRAPVPYLSGLRVPYYLFLGRRR